jgi:hypothetical protein
MQSRRTVLKTVAGASLMSAASIGRVLGANDRVRVGLIGHGLIGTRHLLDFKAQPDVEIVGVSELSDERMEAAAAAAGNGRRSTRTSGSCWSVRTWTPSSSRRPTTGTR